MCGSLHVYNAKVMWDENGGYSHFINKSLSLLKSVVRLCVRSRYVVVVAFPLALIGSLELLVVPSPGLGTLSSTVRLQAGY